jgi:hypothetical protein
MAAPPVVEKPDNSTAQRRAGETGSRSPAMAAPPVVEKPEKPDNSRAQRRAGPKRKASSSMRPVPPGFTAEEVAAIPPVPPGFEAHHRQAPPAQHPPSPKVTVFSALSVHAVPYKFLVNGMLSWMDLCISQEIFEKQQQNRLTN